MTAVPVTLLPKPFEIMQLALCSVESTTKCQYGEVSRSSVLFP